MAVNWRHVVLHRVLNLPERKVPSSEPAASAEGSNPWKQASAAPGPAPTPAPSGSNPWKQAQPPPRTPTGVPWQLVETRKAKVWRRLGRAVLVVVLGLFAWVGVRTTFFPAPEPEPEPLPVAVTFDNETAAAVAARFAGAALTFDEDHPDERADLVALDYGGDSTDLGWNRKGKQDVVSLIPSTVTPASDGTSAVVTVLVRTVGYSRPTTADPWVAEPAEWVTVAVPVSVTSSRVVATAPPTLVGDRGPSRPPAPTAIAEDGDLTSSTRETAEAFFVAYGEGDVSAVEAPGATVAAPTSSWRMQALTDWSVEKGTGSTRTATATVVWGYDGQTATLTQTYAVTLTPVRASDTDRWQISAIHGS